MKRISLKFVLSLFCAIALPSLSYAQSAFDDPSVASASGGTAGLVAVTTDVDGGSVTIGSTSQVVILLRNDGSRPVNIGAITLLPSSGISSTVGLNQCVGEPLDTNALCAIALKVKGLLKGNYRLDALINHDSIGKNLAIKVTGSVDSSGDDVSDLINDIDPVPEEIEFDSVSTGRAQVRSIILRNITSANITISEMFIQGSPQSGFTLDSDCKEMASGQACLASVTWTPTQEGDDSGVLVVRHSGPTGITSIPISGQFQPDSGQQAEIFPDAVPGKGLLVSSQTEVDFGNGIDSKSSITVSLVNVGDQALTINGIRLNDEDSGISIVSNGCNAGTILEPVEACPMTVAWEPVREGDVVDDIQIYHNGARGILVLPLRGSASKPVNKDSQAIVLNAAMSGDGLLRSIPTISQSELGDMDDADDTEVIRARTQGQDADLSGLLDGFVITSLANNRGIISGPGGSRVVFTGQETVIGGALWDVNVRSSSITFSNGDQRVLLLFDKSLSSVNQDVGQSTASDDSDDDDQ